MYSALRQMCRFPILASTAIHMYNYCARMLSDVRYAWWECARAVPTETITINDLELAVIVISMLVLENITTNLIFKHIGTYCNNTSAVSWANRLRTSKCIPAERLLRILGLQIHAEKSSSLTTLSTAGDHIVMADITSRAFKEGKLFHAPKSLTTFFNNTFPLPRQLSWTEYVMPSKLIALVISCVRGNVLPMESLLQLPQCVKNIGNIDAGTVKTSRKIRSSVMHPLSINPSLSLHFLGKSGQASTVEDMKSNFSQSQKRLRPSARPSNWLDNQVQSTAHRKNISSLSKDASKAWDGMTHHRSYNFQYQ